MASHCRAGMYVCNHNIQYTLQTRCRRRATPARVSEAHGLGANQTGSDVSLQTQTRRLLWELMLLFIIQTVL